MDCFDHAPSNVEHSVSLSHRSKHFCVAALELPVVSLVDFSVGPDSSGNPKHGYGQAFVGTVRHLSDFCLFGFSPRVSV